MAIGGTYHFKGRALSGIGQFSLGIANVKRQQTAFCQSLMSSIYSSLLPGFFVRLAYLM